MNKRVRLTNDTLNSYGYRVLTSGVDLTYYEKNPVLLYMHSRGVPIGIMKEIRKENGEITGEPVFDEATELSVQCKKQWEFGSLRMVSIGFDVIETSSDPELLVPGQTRPTVTKSRLFEVSIVDIGSNHDAIRLRKDGKLVTLGDSGDCPLPLLNHKSQTDTPQMELKTLALQLGLPETADEAAISAKLTELNAAKAENDKIRQENEQMKLAQITASVDKAIADKKITADKKQHFLELGKEIGIERLDFTLGAMAPAVKLSQMIETEQEPQELVPDAPNTLISATCKIEILPCH